MAYSATSRIIHKWNKNVNPLCGLFWEYFILVRQITHRPDETHQMENWV